MCTALPLTDPPVFERSFHRAATRQRHTPLWTGHCTHTSPYNSGRESHPVTYVDTFMTELITVGTNIENTRTPEGGAPGPALTLPLAARAAQLGPHQECTRETKLTPRVRYEKA